MGDRLQAGKPSLHVTSQPGQLSLAIPPAGRQNEYWRWLRPSPGKKRRVLRNSRPCCQDCWHTDPVRYLADLGCMLAELGLTLAGSKCWKGDELPRNGPSCLCVVRNLLLLLLFCMCRYTLFSFLRKTDSILEVITSFLVLITSFNIDQVWRRFAVFTVVFVQFYLCFILSKWRPRYKPIDTLSTTSWQQTYVRQLGGVSIQRNARNEMTSLLDRSITAASDDGVCRCHVAKLWQTCNKIWKYWN